MPRKLTAYRLKPERAWYDAIRDAYQALDEHGQKKRVVDAANIGRSTAHRIATAADDLVSYDTMEALRLAINDERGAEVVPPAFTPVRSMSHSRAVETLRAMDARGQLDRMMEWIVVGEELSSLGIFPEMLEAIQRRVAAEREVAESHDAISFQPNPSGSHAMTSRDGKGRHRGSG